MKTSHCVPQLTHQIGNGMENICYSTSFQLSWVHWRKQTRSITVRNELSFKFNKRLFGSFNKFFSNLWRSWTGGENVGNLSLSALPLFSALFHFSHSHLSSESCNMEYVSGQFACNVASHLSILSQHSCAVSCLNINESCRRSRLPPLYFLSFLCLTGNQLTQVNFLAHIATMNSIEKFPKSESENSHNIWVFLPEAFNP